MEPKFHFPKRASILNERPHHLVEGKPDTDGADATAAAVQMRTGKPLHEHVEPVLDVEPDLGVLVGELLQNDSHI